MQKQQLVQLFNHWYNESDRPNQVVGKAPTTETGPETLITMFKKQREIFLMEVSEVIESRNPLKGQNEEIDGLCDVYVTLSGLLNIRIHLSELPVDTEAMFEAAQHGMFFTGVEFYEGGIDRFLSLSPTTPLHEYFTLLTTVGFNILQYVKYDGFAYMNRVLENNMSKFSTDFDMMQASASQYVEKGTQVEVLETTEKGLYWLCETANNKYKKPLTYTDLTESNTIDLSRNF